MNGFQDFGYLHLALVARIKTNRMPFPSALSKCELTTIALSSFTASGQSSNERNEEIQELKKRPRSDQQGTQVKERRSIYALQHRPDFCRDDESDTPMFQTVGYMCRCWPGAFSAIVVIAHRLLQKLFLLRSQ